MSSAAHAIFFVEYARSISGGEMAIVESTAQAAIVSDDIDLQYGV